MKNFMTNAFSRIIRTSNLFRDSEEILLGFGSIDIPGHEAANIMVQSQVDFRPRKLFIPSSVAHEFMVTELKIGHYSQLASVGAIPATRFSDPNFEILCDEAKASTPITLSITNTMPITRTFTGCISGPRI